MAVLVALPYGVRGPEYVLDDWFLLANGRFDGWWAALPAELFRARPGSGVVYALVFGVVGRHPLVAYAVGVALVAIAAVALRALLIRFVPNACATAVAALWLLLPNHGSLTHWATATAITVALILLLAGLMLVADGRTIAGALVLGASVLTYEATAPAAAIGLVAVPVLRGRPWRRPALTGAAILVPVGIWVAANIPTVKQGLGQSADLSLVGPAHAGWGVFPDGPIAAAGLLATTIGITLVVVDAVRRRALSREAALVAAGLVVIAAGTLPFVGYHYEPLGAGDRVNVVAAVGTALLWTGLLAAAPRLLAPVAATAIAAAMAVASWQGAMAWADAADDAARVLAALPPLAPGDEIAVERPPVHRNVSAFADRSNIVGAVQLEAGTRRVTARLTPAR